MYAKVTHEMGAGCSVGVRRRYQLVKDYVHSKDCMTFDVVEGFLSNEESGRPPVILIGENHVVNDSDMAKENRKNFSPEEFAKKTSCVTAFKAVNHIVSKCSSPGAKVYLLLEQTVQDFFRPSEFSSFPSQNQTRFGLSNAIRVSDLHSPLYDQGLEIINFDMFYNLRGFFSKDNHSLKNRLAESNMYHHGMMAEMITAIRKTIVSMGDTTFDIEGAFEACQLRTTLEVEKHRSSVQNYFDDHTKRLGSIKKYSTKMMNERKLSQFKRDYLGDNTDGGEAVGEEQTEKSIQTRFNNYNYNFALFRIMYWIYCFTQFTIDSVDKCSGLNDDVDFANDVLEGMVKKIVKEPYMANMFNFITACGDFITYTMFLRKRVVEQHSDSIFVIYGGSDHTDRFAMLLSRISTHSRDFIKISDRVCRDQVAGRSLLHKCFHSRLLGVEETIGHTIKNCFEQQEPAAQPWFMS
ncbi:unnamed protein product [Ectocarpus sp. 8 AP-2014]